MYDIRIRLEEGDEDRSKLRVSVSELEGEGGKDVVEVPAVCEIARAEEGRSQSPVGKDVLGDGLGDRGLAGPSEPVQPVDGGHFEVFGPRFYLIQDSPPGSFEAAQATTVSELGPFGTTAAVQHRQFSCQIVSL